MVTPAGIAQYPSLNAPDTKFSEDGVYKVTLRLPADEQETQDLITKLEGIRDTAWENEHSPKMLAKQRNAYRPKDVAEEEFDDAGNPTGYVLLNAKCNAVWRDKKTGRTVSLKPELVDSKRNALPEGVQIRAGSKLKLAVQPVGWAMPSSKQYGCSLRLKAVMVIDLVSGSAASAFDIEQDGWEAPQDDGGAFTEQPSKTAEDLEDDIDF